MNISAVITVDKDDIHAKVEGQRLKLKAIDIKAKFSPIHREGVRVTPSEI